MSKFIEAIGNKELLAMPKTAFLAPSKVATLSVLRCYDWAQMMSQENLLVISGFSSRLEKEVLHFLLKGDSPIILVLGRKMYTKIPNELIVLLEEGRLLIISVTNDVRQSKQNAYKRNRFIVEIADEVIFPSVPSEESSLYSIYDELSKGDKHINILYDYPQYNEYILSNLK